MRINTIDDATFGSLTWDREHQEWLGESSMADGTPFSLHIKTLAWFQVPPVDEERCDRTITAQAKEAFLAFRNSDSAARAAVASAYVPLYSEWHHGEIISPTDFQRRLHLDAVRLRPDGTVEIYYGDDDMFYGHALIAHLHAGGRVRNIELFG